MPISDAHHATTSYSMTVCPQGGTSSHGQDGRADVSLLKNIHIADTTLLYMLASLLRRPHESLGYVIAMVVNQIALDS